MLHGAPVTVEAFAASYDRVVRRTFEPGRISRVRARLRSHALDCALIAGADPSRSPDLAARARMLTSQRNRLLMAGTIERLVQRAREPAHMSGVTPQRASMARYGDQLRALAALLRGRGPVYARGMAMIGDLLRDGAGPVYRGEPNALGERLRETQLALTG